MSVILFITALTVFLTYSLNIKQQSKNKYSLWIILSIATALRFVLAVLFDGYETDMNCFNGWSSMIYEEGFSAFYAGEAFTDYPPGYMYILYFIGMIKNLLGFGVKASYVLLKTPAIFCDVITGYLLYKFADKKGSNATLISSVYLFNPAILINSAVWGQVDAVFTLPVFLMFLFAEKRNLIVAYFMFAIAIFIKPQALFYAPILFSIVIDDVILHNYTLKRLLKNLIGGLFAILSILIMALPFGIENVISQYINTISSYSYASVNGYNLWTALGQNWAPLTLSMSLIGYFFIATSTIFCVWQFFKKKSEDRSFYFGALLCFLVFTLSVKMHERYVFPAILLILCSFTISKRKPVFYIYGLLSALQFFNAAHVLFYYNPETYYSTNFGAVSIVFGILTVMLMVYWLVCTFKADKEKEVIEKKIKKQKRDYKFYKKDEHILIVITLIYSAIALYNLGNISSPQSYARIEEGDMISIDLGESYDIGNLQMFLGATHISEETPMTVTFSDSKKNWVAEEIIDSCAVFFWKDIPVSVTARYLEISPSCPLQVMELAVSDNNGNLLLPMSAPTELFDEQKMVPEYQNYKNSTYFDEIYHARTAYEFVNKLPIYEWTHPPLGKLIISAGVKLFGMTPFGWRISGTLFGIFMIPILYYFIKKLFGKTWLAVSGTILLCSDFMHFTQSRISTIDVYVTFFILLMYLFMFLYYKENLFIENRKKGNIMLLLSGIASGLAAASKWSGLYAMIGVAVIFFLSIMKCYTIDKTDFLKRLIKTGLLCCVFFIVIPVAIYALSYIPFLKSNGEGIKGIIDNQVAMYVYHGKTVAGTTHPYSSHWYEWLLDLRPIWYYSETYGDLAESISCLGNPLIIIFGFFAFLYCFYNAINKQESIAILLTIAFASGIIPWMPIERTTYIYHYFPCIPFLIIMILYVVDSLEVKSRKTKGYFILFVSSAVILFALFYPAISGFPVAEWYLDFLEFLPRWNFI